MLEDPLKISFAHLERHPVLNLHNLLSLIGEEEVNVTDQNNSEVKGARLSAILQEWGGFPGKSLSDSAHCNHVVHWPVERAGSFTSAFRAIESDVQRNLADQLVDASCILDSRPNANISRFEWVILGPSGLVVKEHQDMFGTATWNLLLSGKKEWVFRRPNSAVDGSCNPKIMIQLPGDIVWVPEYWWHSVVYKDTSVCLSKNLVVRRSTTEIAGNMLQAAPHLAHVVQACQLLEKRSKEASTCKKII